MKPRNLKSSFPQTTLFLVVAFVVFTIGLYIHIIHQVVQGFTGLEFGFIPSQGLSRGLTPWFTSLFYHSGISHIISNSIPLIIFGVPLEKELGSGRFLTLFLGCGLIGHLTLFCFKHFSTFNHIGASGAVMGIIVYFLCCAISENKRIRGKSGIDFWIVLAVIFFVLPDIAGFQKEIAGIETAVTHLGHLGGGIGGFLFFDIFFRKQ